MEDAVLYARTVHDYQGTDWSSLRIRHVTCEAKQCAIGAAKVIGLHDLDMSVPGGNRSEIPLLFGDNKGVYTVITRPGSLQTTCRHQLKDLVFARDHVSRLKLVYAWITTKRMLADIGTKFPSASVFWYIVPMLCGEHSHFPLAAPPAKRRKTTTTTGTNEQAASNQK